MKKIMIFVTLAFSSTNNFAMDAWEACEPIIDDLESFEQAGSDELIVDDNPPQRSGLETQLLTPQFTQSDQVTAATPAPQEPAYISAEDDGLFGNHDDSKHSVESADIESISKKHQSAVAIEALAVAPLKKNPKATFQCEVCHQILVARCRKRHMRTHGVERPFECTVPGCGMTFKERTYLQQHVRIHSDENPYECPYAGCGQAFNQPGNLHRHIQGIHCKVKPYVCDFCDKAFSQKSNLREHLQSKHHRAEFTCPICHIAYASDIAFANHLLSHNAAENQQIKSIHP